MDIGFSCYNEAELSIFNTHVELYLYANNRTRLCTQEEVDSLVEFPETDIVRLGLLLAENADFSGVLFDEQMPLGDGEIVPGQDATFVMHCEEHNAHTCLPALANFRALNA